MKFLTKPVLALFLACSTLAVARADGSWLTSYKQALKVSKETGKPILADFTGSDWCHWCIQLHREVFDTAKFKKWAAKNVVLLELDYPRRTPQPAELRQQNLGLLRKFSYIRGYPTILFLKSDGTAFGKYGYDWGGPDHWTQFADRLLKLKQGPTAQR